MYDRSGRERGKEEAARSHSGGKVKGDVVISTRITVQKVISATYSLPFLSSALVELHKPEPQNNREHVGAELKTRSRIVQ